MGLCVMKALYITIHSKSDALSQFSLRIGQQIEAIDWTITAEGSRLLSTAEAVKSVLTLLMGLSFIKVSFH